MALRTQQKNVLLLGAGYVSAPVVDYLTRDETIGVTVGKVEDIIDQTTCHQMLYSLSKILGSALIKM